MRYRLLGNSGLRVSELCLGTMTFGDVLGWGADFDESRRMFAAFLEAGGNFVDTANNYTQGTSEQFLGELIGPNRDRLVVATKATMTGQRDDPNAGGNHRKNIVQTVEASLTRLKTEYLDLLWIHAWDQITPVEELMRTLDDLVRQGKVLYVGISNTPAWVVAHANTLATLRGWTPFVGIQVEYSPIERTPERELLPMARALGLGVTSWSPLGAGLLTGKYRQQGGASGPKRGDAMTIPHFNERSLAIADVVAEVAAGIGRSPAQVALAWVRHHGAIPIVGGRSTTQIVDNLASLEVTLGETELARLDEVSAVESGYPTDFLARDGVRGSVYGGMRDRIDDPRLA
ncbi:MAG: aldo/keto reductase [Chloroflexi bacterium]|nr:aldo/keto reductase [Chloroflexota bacterium]